MPKPKKGSRLGSGPAHQRLMLRNLARSLFENERIQTTETKAKMLRPFAEKLITKAKKGGVHNRRLVLAHIEDRAVVHKLFDDIGPRFSERDGGYTRILKLGPRQGDAAPMALIELVDEGLATTVTEAASEVSGRRRLRRPTRRRKADPEAQDQTTDSSEPDEEPSAVADAAETATEEPTPAASEDAPAAPEDAPEASEDAVPDAAESEPSAEATPEAEPADDEDKDS